MLEDDSIIVNQPDANEPTGWLRGEEYAKLVDSTALPGVDILLCSLREGAPAYLLIERLDEVGNRALNLIGGRIRRDESIAESLERHIENALSPGARFTVTDLTHPIGVTEYLAQPAAPGGPFDPRKHQVSLNYIGAVEGELVAGGEALDFAWFDLKDDAPERVGFGQRSVINELIAAARSSQELASLLA